MKENEVQLYRQSTDLSRTVSLAIHVKKQTTMKKQHIKIPQITKKYPGRPGILPKSPPDFHLSREAASDAICLPFSALSL